MFHLRLEQFHFNPNQYELFHPMINLKLLSLQFIIKSNLLTLITILHFINSNQLSLIKFLHFINYLKLSLIKFLKFINYLHSNQLSLLNYQVIYLQLKHDHLCLIILNLNLHDHLSLIKLINHLLVKFQNHGLNLNFNLPN